MLTLKLSSFTLEMGSYLEYLTSHLPHLMNLTAQLSVISVPFLGLLSSVFTFKAIFPVFHFFTSKKGPLSLFTLVTLDMVSPPEIPNDA